MFEASETSSFLKRAEVSIDGQIWKTVYANDGISDGPRELYIVDLTLTNPGDHSIALRVFDSSGNVGTVRISVKN